MALRKILTIPDSILRQKSLPVDKVNKEIKTLMDDMLNTMYDAPGIGLAAIQIGIPKRIIVIDLSKDPEKKNPMYFVNPKITWKSDLKSTYEEGCLSIPNQFANIYSGPIILEETRVVKAIAVEINDEGYHSSFMEYGTFFISENFSLPIMSVSGNQLDNLIDNGNDNIEPWGTFEYYKNGILADKATGEFNEH